MSFEIVFKKSAEKDLNKIDRRFHKIIFRKIEELKNYPHITGIKKLSTTGTIFRMRVGDYRVVFQLFKHEKQIIIFYIRHRKVVYRDL